MQSILFSLEAISSMLNECYRVNNNYETGGILVGPKKHKTIVTDIVPSTIYAERSPATFYQSEKDVTILNLKLRRYQKNNFDFKGYFHKHPSGLFQLSAGDLSTCNEIFQSPNYQIDNFLIMLIITDNFSQDSPLFSYAVSLSSDKILEVEKTTLKVLPKNCILECAECFEPLEKGVSHEINTVRQYRKRAEKITKSNIVRNSGGENNSGELS